MSPLVSSRLAPLRQGFARVEWLVMMGILAGLADRLPPLLASATAGAARVACMPADRIRGSVDAPLRLRSCASTQRQGAKGAGEAGEAW